MIQLLYVKAFNIKLLNNCLHITVHEFLSFYTVTVAYSCGALLFGNNKNSLMLISFMAWAVLQLTIKIIRRILCGTSLEIQLQIALLKDKRA